jgi:hypothetical protein
MAQNIFLGFDTNENLYIQSSATFDITSNINNIQQSLNTGIDCVGYIDVSMSYFNDVFSFVVFNTEFTRNHTISEIINNGDPNDIHYYVEFIDDDPSKENWYNRFIWFNPAYARCPPRSVKNSLDITDDNKIVNNAYPINGNVVPRIIKTTSITPLYYDASWSEVSVRTNDQVYMALEETITINGIEYYKDCLVLSTLKKGLVRVSYFEPVFDVLTIEHLNYYNTISTAQMQIERILSSDRLIDEYIRYLSYCLTDSPNNVGLISNYKDIQTQISNYCSSNASAGGVVMTRLKEKLIDLDIKTADVSFNPTNTNKKQEISGAFQGEWYVDNSFNQSLNITRQLLIGAINQGRGLNFSGTDIINETRVYYTFIPGDKITFTFTINGPPLTDAKKIAYLDPQNTDFQEILIKPRKYRIFANIIN